MEEYDSDAFDPPAPTAKVTLKNPKNGASVDNVKLLIDTGADITLLPATSTRQIGVPTLPDRCEVMAFDGSTSHASVVELDLIFLQRIFSGRYLLTNDPDGIIGRDILNRLTLTLDGPRNLWSEAPPSEPETIQS